MKIINFLSIDKLIERIEKIIFNLLCSRVKKKNNFFKKKMHTFKIRCIHLLFSLFFFLTKYN